MAEEIILSADLYNNAVTERTDDYTAKPRVTGTARNRQVAERIVARGSEFRVETIDISSIWQTRKRPFLSRWERASWTEWANT